VNAGAGQSPANPATTPTAKTGALVVPPLTVTLGTVKLTQR
jgi:hypothetical protein